jgi:hypothetical protein
VAASLKSVQDASDRAADASRLDYHKKSSEERQRIFDHISAQNEVTWGKLFEIRDDLGVPKGATLYAQGLENSLTLQAINDAVQLIAAAPKQVRTPPFGGLHLDEAIAAESDTL